MATYIQGQADYISQIQPTEPNLAFDAQILQAKQSKYDANHKKVSELYGSLLNASLTRSDNIQARDEFFKIINDDIRRMGGLDFSLDQNVQAAAGVFQSIYTNNNIVKDMVWTKNYNNQVNKSNSFKNCLDEEKCGGVHWDEGDAYLEYKRNEFKNASAGDAMNMSDPEYIPYRSVMKQAIKLAKDAGLNVEMDSLNGGYVVTTKNGILLKTPLTELFSSTIGADPNFIKQFKVKSFVDRNNWVNNKLSMGEFDNQTDAQMGYLRDVDRINKLKLENAADQLGTDLGSIEDELEELKTSYEKGEFKEGSDDYNKMMALAQLQNQNKQALQYVQEVNNISVLENKNAALSVLSDAVDEQSALASLLDEINSAANTLSKKDSKVSLKADEFAKMAQEHQYNMSEIAVKHRNAIELENIEFEQRKEFAEFEKSIGSNKYLGGVTSAQAAILSQEIEQLNNDINTFNPEEKAAEEFKKNNGSSASLAEIENWENSSDANDRAKYKKYEKELEKQKVKLENKKIDVNKRNIKKGEEPQFPDLLTKEAIQQVKNKKPEYEDDWADEIKLKFKQKYPKLTDEIFDAAYASAGYNDELYSYLDGYFQNNIK